VVSSCYKHLDIAINRIKIVEERLSRLENHVLPQPTSSKGSTQEEVQDTADVQHPNIQDLPQYVQKQFIAAQERKYGVKVLPVNYMQNLYKKDNIFYSDAFFSHERGYKLRLEVCLYNTDEMFTFGLQVMKGPYDEELRWPFNIQYTLSFLHRLACANNGFGNLRESCGCSQLITCNGKNDLQDGCFQKPTREFNTSHGFSRNRVSQYLDKTDKNMLYLCCTLKLT
jgi:hypothetical protein